MPPMTNMLKCLQVMVGLSQVSVRVCSQVIHECVASRSDKEDNLITMCEHVVSNDHRVRPKGLRQGFL